MATAGQRKKGKCEELAVASSGSKKLSDLGFVINPKKKNTPEAVSGFETLDDLASVIITFKSASQYSESANISRRHHLGLDSRSKLNK